MGGSKSKLIENSARNVLAQQRKNEGIINRVADATVQSDHASKSVSSTIENKDGSHTEKTESMSMRSTIPVKSQVDNAEIDSSILHEISKWSAVVSSDSVQVKHIPLFYLF